MGAPRNDMSFSEDWERQYSAGAHQAQWPWSDLVSSYYQYAGPGMGYDRVLELGVGAGANVPFFAALGVDYHACDGSQIAVDALRARFPQFADKIVVADFSKDLGHVGPFDVVIDRSSLPCGTNGSINSALSLLSGALRRGGRLISIDWFSTEHSGFALGRAIDDNTRIDFPDGFDLHQIGPINFLDRPRIDTMLKKAGLRLVALDHKVTQVHLPEPATTRAWWNFVAEKV